MQNDGLAHLPRPRRRQCTQIVSKSPASLNGSPRGTICMRAGVRMGAGASRPVAGGGTRREPSLIVWRAAGFTAHRWSRLGGSPLARASRPTSAAGRSLLKSSNDGRKRLWTTPARAPTPPPGRPRRRTPCRRMRRPVARSERSGPRARRPSTRPRSAGMGRRSRTPADHRQQASIQARPDGSRPGRRRRLDRLPRPHRTRHDQRRPRPPGRARGRPRPRPTPESRPARRPRARRLPWIALTSRTQT